MDENKGPLSGREPTAPQGPMRRAPRYYIGKTVGGRWRPKGTRGKQHARQMRLGGRNTMHRDTECYPNGAVAGIRDKAARRLIRSAFKQSHSSFTKPLRLARAMKAQAFEVAADEKKSARWARRLLAKELAIHTPVYAPDKKTIRKMRTAARKAKRAGKHDAISQLVDSMAETKP
jgi:hypothetical protein